MGTLCTGCTLCMLIKMLTSYGLKKKRYARRTEAEDVEKGAENLRRLKTQRFFCQGDRHPSFCSNEYDEQRWCS